MLGNVIFQSIVALVGALLISVSAVVYFQRVRLERPSIGTFNGRDVVVVGIFITALPLLYLLLPTNILTGLLAVTFFAATYIALRPVLPAPVIVVAVAALVITDITVTYNMLGTQAGWHIYNTISSLLVFIAAVAVGNLFVQGGMFLRHVAFLALFLAVYDAVFTMGFPVIQQLADTFEGQPLTAAFSANFGSRSADIGLGDLLVFALFSTAVYKAYGRRGLQVMLPLIAVFGALVPGMAPLVIQNFVREGTGIVVPVQIFFGPVAFLAYRYLRRQGPERTAGEWFAEQDAAARQPIRVRPRTRAAAQPAR